MISTLALLLLGISMYTPFNTSKYYGSVIQINAQKYMKRENKEVPSMCDAVLVEPVDLYLAHFNDDSVSPSYEIHISYTQCPDTCFRHIRMQC